MRELGDEDLFRCVAHMRGVVHHQGLRVDPLQQVRGGDVGHVEGRILAQQNHVDAREVDA
jgi:hypothetical protein